MLLLPVQRLCGFQAEQKLDRLQRRSSACSLQDPVPSAAAVCLRERHEQPSVRSQACPSLGIHVSS